MKHSRTADFMVRFLRRSSQRCDSGRSARKPERSLVNALTPREHDVLAEMAKGQSNKRIARELAISEHGVKRLVSSILAKLQCPTRTLAVAYAIESADPVSTHGRHDDQLNGSR
ncbi:regulatory LuxR family protein [Saccharopolyspora dendranthemae]|uniref:Regulatory LuxR family protein n=1 Tax=Saccharopolyspora dendranthemae TaxID=1181886 RepID=A0A561U7R9_9PSEU|nr:regulatory LuxR family protein [Saccharopolyspora dendranthemae]